MMRDFRTLSFIWVTIGDQKVCDDCQGREGESNTMAVWETVRGLPRSAMAGTVCDGSCRCDLFPSDMTEGEAQKELQKLIDEAIEEMMSGIKIDMSTGRKLLLKAFDNIGGMYVLPYAKITQMENLIGLWKAEHGTLPLEFFKLADIELMTRWLQTYM